MGRHRWGNTASVDEVVADGLIAGRFRLGPTIGIGSTALVHRARDLHRGDDVAVKLFRPGASDDDERRQRREIASMTGLDHPGLVRLRAGGVCGGRPYVVTDLVEGPTLAERITAGPLAAEHVHRLGAELGAALAYVHAAGIVHRDVKPANVLLGDGSRSRLADFGIAKMYDGAAITGTGTVIGTAAFLAPEQARGEHVGPAADVYALGLVLLEALTARREYPGPMVESASARLHRRPAVPAGLPGGLTPLLREMTADNPHRRPSADAVAARLRRVPSCGRHRLRRARRRGVAIPVAVAVLLAGGVGAALAGGADPPPTGAEAVVVDAGR